MVWSRGLEIRFFSCSTNNLKDFLTSLKSLASESYSTVNTPTQFAAVEAYEGNYEEYKNKVKGNS